MGQILPRTARMEITLDDRGNIDPYAARGPNIISDGMGAGNALGINRPGAQKNLYPPSDRGNLAAIFDLGTGNIEDFFPKAQFFRTGPTGNYQPLVFRRVEFTNGRIGMDLVAMKP